MIRGNPTRRRRHLDAPRRSDLSGKPMSYRAFRRRWWGLPIFGLRPAMALVQFSGRIAFQNPTQPAPHCKSTATRCDHWVGRS